MAGLEGPASGGSVGLRCGSTGWTPTGLSAVVEGGGALVGRGCPSDTSSFGSFDGMLE